MNFKKEIVKKLIASALSLYIFLGNGGFFGFAQVGTALAIEMPTPPSAPTAPPAQTPPPAPSGPTSNPSPIQTAPPVPTAPPAQTPPPAPSNTPRPTYAPSPTTTSQLESSSATTSPSVLTDNEEVAGDTNTASSLPVASFDINKTGGEDNDTGVGSTINTGDANSNSAILTDGNSNVAGTPGSAGGGSTVVNSDNGSDSSNSGSATVNDNSSTTQNNSANILNNLNQAAISGSNTNSRNTGGDSVIESGNSNTTGTIITAVNSNVSGVMVSEFNVVEDHMGDLILDFGEGCFIGCGGGDSLVKNIGNGSGSNNTADLTENSNSTTEQNNNLTLTNNMGLIADSGDNHADRNTGGDSVIVSGDANVAANVLTFANNNIAGGVVYGIVNIFGELIGDIILPESYFQTCCGVGDVKVGNIGNGANSTNDASLNLSDNDTTQQFNNLELQNNIILDANTGNNSTSDNTGGNSSVSSGDASTAVQLLNFANNNIVGGNWWLVIVNEAGRWVGHIMGADGANVGGSEGFAFDVSDAGDISVSNDGNGANSTNDATLNSTDDDSIVQNNNAKIVNNLDLRANTGDNSASRNTNGNSRVVTGDADIVANIVNFVNNNITGGGKLVVTVVNVFGSWLGDFVGPGFTKDAPLAENEHQEDSNTNTAGNGNSDSSNSQTNSDTTSSGNSNSGNSGSGNTNTNKAVGVLAAFSSQTGTFNVTGGAALENLIDSASVQNTALGKKVVNINLAWLILGFLPLGFLTIILRRRYFFLNLFSKKRHD